jgi:hypothetical protein
MGFDNGRCKLVLSMRGNPLAESTLADIPASQLGPVVEAMTAHEVAHCWRNVQGIWHKLPAGFVESRESTTNSKEINEQWQDMQATRREEGYADLVGLAWTQAHHPEQYAAVHAWFEQMRQHQPVEGGYHDTRIWIRLARNGSAFGTTGTPFERARSLWQKGLLSNE